MDNGKWKMKKNATLTEGVAFFVFKTFFCKIQQKRSEKVDKNAKRGIYTEGCRVLHYPFFIIRYPLSI